MGVFTPDPAPHRIHTVHRAGAAALGGFLLLFGLMGVTRVTEFLSTSGTVTLLCVVKGQPWRSRSSRR